MPAALRFNGMVKKQTCAFPYLRWVAAAGLALLLVGSGCARPVPARKTGWLGLNTPLGYTDPVLGAHPAALSEQDRRVCMELVSELRVPMIRDLGMNWASVQPARGARYDFSRSDDLVRRAQSARADLLAVCWGIPAWASAPGSPGLRAGGGSAPGSADFGVPAREHTDAFRAFVRRFVKRYDGDGSEDMPGLRQPVRAYEFMSQMEDIPTAEYAYWLRVFYETVKEAHPRVTVVLGSLRSPGMPMIDQPEGDYPTYFERLLAEPVLDGPRYPYFDVVSFHNYPARYPGRTEFDESLAYLRRTMASRNLALPIWLTEYGFDSGSDQEEQQKDNIVKWAIHARALGIERVYLCGLHDGPRAGGSAARENLGLVREAEAGQAPARKPAFHALSALLAELSERPHVSRRSEGVYMLTGKGEPAYVVWRDESYNLASLLIPDWWEMRNLSGRAIKRQGSDIEPDASPVFLQRVRSPFIK